MAKQPCPQCGSVTYQHSRWKDRKLIACSDCPKDSDE